MSFFKLLEDNSLTARLEKQFTNECVTLKKKGGFPLSNKSVSVKINWNKNELLCLPSTQLKRGDIIYDPYNKFSLKITFIAKRQIDYPKNSGSLTQIKLDLCNFTRMKEN